MKMAERNKLIGKVREDYELDLDSKGPDESLDGNRAVRLETRSTSDSYEMEILLRLIGKGGGRCLQYPFANTYAGQMNISFG